MCRRRMKTPTVRSIRALDTTPNRDSRGSAARLMLSRIDRLGMIPSALRFSGSRLTPARMAPVMDRLRRGAPATVTCPASRVSAPAIALAVSVRPAPSSPPRPSTSPWRSSLETSARACRRVSPVARRYGGAPGRSCVSPGCGAGSRTGGRPSMSETRPGRPRPVSGPVCTTLPSRSRVTRSQTAYSSSSRWLAYRTDLCRARCSSMTRKSVSISGGAIAAVGSSSTITRAPAVTARARATSFCAPAPREPRGRRGSARSPYARRISAARWCIRAVSISPNLVRGSSPRKRLRATLIERMRLSSWWTARMPARRAPSGPSRRRGSPSRRSRPLSGRSTPASTLTRVDLPAPFSPASACTSPGARESETWSSARTPEYALTIAAASRAGRTTRVLPRSPVPVAPDTRMVPPTGLSGQPGLDAGDVEAHAAGAQLVQLLRRGGLAGDQVVDLVGGHRLDHRVDADLGVVGQHHDHLRGRREGPDGAGAQQDRGGQAAFGGEAVAGDEGAAGAQAGQRAFGGAADQRLDRAAQRASGHHHLDARGRRQCLRHEQGVGDDGQLGVAAQPLREHVRRRARAEHHRGAVLDQRDGQIGDGRLLLLGDLGLLQVGGLAGQLTGQGRAAVVAVEQAVGLQRAYVAPYGDLRGLDGLGELAQGERAVRAEQFEDPHAPLGAEHRLTPVRRSLELAHGTPLAHGVT